jgi:hypothetical protein
MMSIQELEEQLLSLDQIERQRIANLLNHSLSNPQPNASTRKNVADLTIDANTIAWDTELEKLKTPAHTQALADLLQSWEDEDNEQEQQETWKFLRQALDHDRLSERSLLP